MSTPECSATAWATPVRPLVGQAKHCVWGGDTPTRQIRAASYAWWRQQGRTAVAAVALMREDVANATVRFPRHYPDAHRSFAAYGEDRVRWIEAPEALGLRFVGLAQDVCSRHHGWFLHPDEGDVVCGVIYRISGKDGRGRFLAGYADPWNCDKTGPALLCLDPMVGRFGDDDYIPDSVAQRADRMAERMAEDERDYQSAYEAGREARRAGREMREVAALASAALRACRAVLRNRHQISRTEARLIMTAQIAHLRGLFVNLRSTRDAFRAGLATRHDWDDPHGWRGGYCDG